MPTGRFIALDGPDGTGKSTQCRLLVDRLRAAGVAVTAAVDPGGTPVGVKLRELLLFGRDHALSPRGEAMLFMASRAELVHRVIRPALDRGDVVVSDRYLLSTVVYQGHAGGLDPGELWTIGTFAAGGAMPDRTVVFDLAPDLAAARRKADADRFESQGAEYFVKVRAGFLAEAVARPDLYRVIDSAPPLDQVHAAVWAAVADLLPGGGG